MVGCSDNKTEVSQTQIDALNTQIKSGKFEEIYKDSSVSLQSIISEELFVGRMEKAVERMKQLDEHLNFQKSSMSDILADLLNDKSFTNNFQKLEKNNKKLEFLTQWIKEAEGNSFKLRSLVIVELTETGKNNIYYIEEDKIVTE